MRGDVGELLQLSVGPHQLGGLLIEVSGLAGGELLGRAVPATADIKLLPHRLDVGRHGPQVGQAGHSPRCAGRKSPFTTLAGGGPQPVQRLQHRLPQDRIRASRIAAIRTITGMVVNVQLLMVRTRPMLALSWASRSAR